MERNRFLQLAFEAATGKDVRVRYIDTEYRPLAYTIYAVADGSYRHSVTLHDLHANSVVTASLDAVEEVQSHV